eukprot:3239952-Pyramimonas_sp.AAC.2
MRCCCESRHPFLVLPLALCRPCRSRVGAARERVGKLGLMSAEICHLGNPVHVPTGEPAMLESIHAP